MGTCYTYLLYDDFDWGYRNKSKEEMIESLKQELPVADVVASWSHYIVVDLDKNSPWGENVQILKKYCDSAFYYTDTSGWDIKQVEFKKPEPGSIEAPPAERIDRRAAIHKLLSERKPVDYND